MGKEDWEKCTQTRQEVSNVKFILPVDDNGRCSRLLHWVDRPKCELAWSPTSSCSPGTRAKSRDRPKFGNVSAGKSGLSRDTRCKLGECSASVHRIRILERAFRRSKRQRRQSPQKQTRPELGTERFRTFLRCRQTWWWSIKNEFIMGAANNNFLSLIYKKKQARSLVWIKVLGIMTQEGFRLVIFIFNFKNPNETYRFFIPGLTSTVLSPLKTTRM